MTSFTLYLDDSGSPKPNIKDSTPHFALGGILVNDEDQQEIITMIREFKNRWGISYDIPLHAVEIRSKKNKFSFLNGKSQAELDKFFADITELIVKAPFLVQACVISRQGYLDRYSEIYGDKTWNMLKTALCIVLERSLKYVLAQQGELRIVFEKIGRREDRLITSIFYDYRSNGNPFDVNRSQLYNPLDTQIIESRLLSIQGSSKKNELLQLADLCLFPVACSKTQSNNRAFNTIIEARKLIDYHVLDTTTEGIKFYCY